MLKNTNELQSTRRNERIGKRLKERIFVSNMFGIWESCKTNKCKWYNRKNGQKLQHSSAMIDDFFFLVRKKFLLRTFLQSCYDHHSCYIVIWNWSNWNDLTCLTHTWPAESWNWFEMRNILTLIYEWNMKNLEPNIWYITDDVNVTWGIADWWIERSHIAATAAAMLQFYSICYSNALQNVDANWSNFSAWLQLQQLTRFMT